MMNGCMDAWMDGKFCRGVYVHYMVWLVKRADRFR